MDVTEEDKMTKEMNLIFKCLGERGEEGQQWKEFTENVVFYILQFLSAVLNTSTVKHVVVRPYGSAAEDLKCLEPDDVGDVDIVIFPNCDNLIIDEEMIEYSPGNPLHVRIKGQTHPVLKSCLAENTGYVATSALKNFNSDIYGKSWSRLFKFIIQSLRQIKSQDTFQSTCHLKNKVDGPAVTLDFAQSSQDAQDLPNVYAAQWEWLICHLCSACGKLHTREHAEIVKVASQFSSGVLLSATCGKGLTYASKILSFADFYCSGRGQDLRAKFRDATRVQIKTRREMTNCLAHVRNVDQQSLKQEYDYGEISSRHPISCFHGTLTEPCNSPKKAEDGHRSANELKQSNKLQVDHLARTVAEAKGNSSIEDEDAGKLNFHQHVGGLDFVPALRSHGWPKVAREWIKRERKWPSHTMVESVIQEGFHLVVKPPKNGNPDCDFRISFGHAEYLLSQEMNEIQRKCYRCLKRYHRAYLAVDPKGLVTFHLKNILLQTIEETGAEVWTENNRVECMLKLLGNLLEALRKRELRHFFVRSYNLFGGDYIESPKILGSLAGKVEQIINNPIQFAKAITQKRESEASQKEKRVPTRDLTGCAKSSSADKEREYDPFRKTSSFDTDCIPLD